jgi:hypothetical protein
MIAQAHVVSFQFSMDLNHKQCNNTMAVVTKITRRITIRKTQEVMLGKPFSTKGKKNPATLYYIAKRRTFTP